MTFKQLQWGTIWRLGVVTLLLGLVLALMAYRVIHQPAMSLDASTGAYQGNPHCVLVANLHADEVASTIANRVQINATRDCTLCSDSWSVTDSETIRLRVFIRPCPPQTVSTVIRPFVKFASTMTQTP